MRITKLDDLVSRDNWLTTRDKYAGLMLSSLLINILSLVFPITMLQVYDRVIPNKSYETLSMLVSLVIGCLFLEVLLKIARAYISSWSSARFTYNIGILTLDKMLYSKLNEVETQSPGLYLEKYNMIEDIKDFYCGQNQIFWVDIPFVIVFLTVMVMVNIYIAISSLIILSLMIIFSVSVHYTLRAKIQKKSKFSETKLKFLIELISGIHNIKSLGVELLMMRRYEKIHSGEILDNFELSKYTGQAAKVATFFTQLGVIVTAALGGFLVVEQQITVGGLACCILLSGKIMQPIAKVISYWNKMPNLDISIKDLKEILCLKSEFDDDMPKIGKLRGKVELRNLSYHHFGHDRHIFTDLNMVVNPGDCIAIHGDSVSGKSTLLSIIGGLYKPTLGSVLYDDVDLNTVELDDARSQIGFLPQFGELFNGTIIDNLTVFQNEEMAKKAKEMCILLGLDSDIMSMPDGYLTQVETGTVDSISKGHKQLIILTRSLLQNPQVILFDSANSSLDLESDNRVRRYFEMLVGNRTIIMVTNRPSWLKLANKHYELLNGNIQEIEWT